MISTPSRISALRRRIVNMNALRQRWPPRGPRPPDIIPHTQTLAAQEPMPQQRIFRPSLLGS